MIETSPEFQLAIALSSGLFFGAYSMGLFITFLYIIFFELMVFCTSVIYPSQPPGVIWLDRLFINLVFISSWMMSRYLYLRETGFEPTCDYVAMYFQS